MLSLQEPRSIKKGMRPDSYQTHPFCIIILFYPTDYGYVCGRRLFANV
jgi:hypothetical protein